MFKAYGAITQWKNSLIYHTTEVVVSVVYFISFHELNHCQLHKCLSETKADYPDLPYHTAVQWFNSDKVLL